MTSHIVRAIDLYSALVLLQATTLCLLDFQERGEEPRSMQNPEVDSLVLGQPTQSLSQKVRS